VPGAGGQANAPRPAPRLCAKCAEAQAIRKGWPEDLSNTFVGEEIEQAALTLDPAQAAAEGATRERLEWIGGHGALIIDWLDAAPLDAVPLGQLADRIVAFLRERREDPQTLISWRERNRQALREFWARAPPMPWASNRSSKALLANSDCKHKTTLGLARSYPAVSASLCRVRI
jgi:hypothetical protein